MTDEHKKRDLALSINEFLDNLTIVIPLFQEYAQRIKDAFHKGHESLEIQFDRNILDVDARSLEFIKDYTYDLIKKTNTEMIDKLKGVFSRGVLNDVDKSQMVEEIKSIISDTKQRAQMIFHSDRLLTAPLYTTTSTTFS